MTIQTAIEKAIEGGWMTESKVKFIAPYDGGRINDMVVCFDWNDDGMPDTWQRDLGSLLLDPLFWQALGKSLGWKEKKDFPKTYLFGFEVEILEEWEYRWFQFIHHLSKRESIESFFEPL